jgi:trk system potassium uptake protein TrkA
MKIVIAGAGDVGFHLAQLLSIENQDITLLDTNQEVLEYAGGHLDLITLKGDATSFEVLKNAEVSRADLFLAVTTLENANLISGILAKKLGAKQTIVRVNNPEYLEAHNRLLFENLGIDLLISPRQLSVEEIYRLVKQCSFTDVFEFEEGKISVTGVTIDDKSPLLGLRLNELPLFSKNVDIRVLAILRSFETIIPRGETLFQKNDHVYFISKKEKIKDLQLLIGKKEKTVKNIAILGGNAQGYLTAKKLEQEYRVTIFEKDKNRCKELNELLNDTLVIKTEYSDFETLKEEGLGKCDVFLALTDNSETNIIACLTAKNFGVFKTIAQVESKIYTHMSQDIGVDTLINKKLIAANNIFRFVRKGSVKAITSLHGVDAEIIEFSLEKDLHLLNKPLKDIPFPNHAFIAGVIREEESYLPNGDFELIKGDKVIVFTLSDAIPALELLFL